MASTSTSTPPLASPPSPKTIILTSSDGLKEFVLNEKVAFQSQTLKAACRDCDDDNDGPAPKIKANDSNKRTNIKLDSKCVNITAETLDHVIEYCEKHADDHTHTFDEQHQLLREWDQLFIQKFDRNQLFDIMLAADYLEIRNLLSLSAQSVADSMKDMSVEEVREIFGIVNDYTPKEEEALRLKNQWAFV